MAAKTTWRLRRFARYTPPTDKDDSLIPWKVFDGGAKKSHILLTILDTGYLLVMQGQKSLDTMHLISSGNNINAQQKSENLLFRYTLMGESRMTRLQFQGKNKEEATKECASALKKVMEFLPGACVEDAPQPLNQTHTETPETQVACTQQNDNVQYLHNFF